MSASGWVSLSTKWTITEVQAGLQVVIALLATWGIFGFARFCWQLSSTHVPKDKNVALASLMSIRTLGEAYDALFLLKRRTFTLRYWNILAQSIVVLLLTITMIVSGPIAKAATRIGEITPEMLQRGLLATNTVNSLAFGNVLWNQTATSLDHAGFPYDQLLDYLPDTNSSWVYRPNEWNSSWSMDCQVVDNAPLTLFESGNCSSLFSELPGLNRIFNPDEFDTFYSQAYSRYVNSKIIRDSLVILAGWTYPGYDNVTGVTTSMTVTVVSLLNHNAANTDDDEDAAGCTYGNGTIESSSYSMMNCSLTRIPTLPNAEDTAYPDHGDQDALPTAYISNFFNRINSASSQDLPVPQLTPYELIRFYQSYLIVKDTQYVRPVQRTITTRVRVVQLSVAFIVVTSLMAILVILGLLNYLHFRWRYRHVAHDLPETKLDWVVQSITEGPMSDAVSVSSRATHTRYSVVAATGQNAMSLRKSDKVRHVFENAKYGTHAQEELSPLNQRSSTITRTPGSIRSHFSHHTDASQPGQMGHPTPPEYFTYNSYNASPYDAQFAAAEEHVGLGLQSPESQMYDPRGHRGYARLT